MNNFFKNYYEDLTKFDSLLAFLLSLVLFYFSSNKNLVSALKYSITFVLVFLLLLNIFT